MNTSGLLPTTLNFMVNDICNSRCKMCRVWKQQAEREITPEELSTILRDPLFSNLRYVGISGGEPTLRRDLPEIFRVIACKGGIKGTGLITNALDAEHIIKQVTRCNEVCMAANLPFNVMVSLDGIGRVHDTVRGRKGAFENALQVIRYVRDNTNIAFSIGCTVIKQNVWHLDEVLDFCGREKVPGRFRIGEFINRLYNRDLKACIRNFNKDERYQIALFFSKLELYYESSPDIKATYRNIRQMIFEGKPRESGCPYRSEAVGLDSRCNLLFCSPKSPDLGSCLEKSATIICEDSRPIRESIIQRYCSDCIHDYHSAPSKESLEEYAQEKLLRNFMSVRQSIINSTKLPSALPELLDWSNFKKALIVGWYGTETAGDKAIISDIIRRLKDANSKIQITVGSLYPFVTSRTLYEIGVENIRVIKTYSPEYIDTCKSTDAVVMGGGPLMGMEPLGFVLTAFSEARKANIPCIIEGCGIGPLIEDIHIMAVKEILRLSKQIRVRDKTSLSWVSENTGRFDAICTGDPAARFVEEWKKETLQPQEIKSEAYFACLLREITFEYANGKSLTDFLAFRERFEKELGKLIRHIREKTGLKPFLMPMHTFAVGQDDRDFARRFAETNLQDGDYDIGNKVYSPQDILTIMSRSKFNVCMRFHSVLFAEKLDVPFVAIDYTGGGKIKGFLKDQNKLELMFDNTDLSNKNWRPKIDTMLLKHSLRSMNVVHLCSQDYGGAGKAAYRLHKGLQQIGVASTMLVVNKKSGDPSVKVLPSKYLGSLKQSLNVPTYESPLWPQQMLRWETELAKYPNRPAGLEIFTDALSDIQLEQIQDIRDADIINLHWVAGTLDYPKAPLALRDKKIVWTLHDMNPFTGGCHYSGDCEKYKESCGACPQLGATIEEELSRQIWNQKFYAFQSLDLNIVTPSKWLANCASQSRLLSKNPVKVIPNGFPLDTFKPYTKIEIRKALNIPEFAKVILFGADSIVNARKGFAYLLEALKRLPPNKEYATVILTFGVFPEGLKINTKHTIYNLGSITDENQLVLAYSAADVFVIPSLEDNLPNTVVEAMACGVPVVGFAIGGIPDMIDHKKNGFLARPKDIDSLLEGIEWAISSPDGGTNISALCRETVETKFAQEVQANAYKEMYDAIISNQSLKSEDISTKQNKLEHNLQRNSKTADLLYQEAHKLIDEGRIEEAIETLEKLITKNYSLALAYNDLGVLYFNQGENKSAQRYYEKAIQLQPENIKFQKSLADYYDKIGQQEQALGIYINILRENPEDLEVLLALGFISNDLRKYDESFIFCQKALEISPANIKVRDAYLKLGDKIKLSGDLNKTREIYLYYLSRNPEDEKIKQSWEELNDTEKDKQIIKKIKAKKKEYIVSAIVSTYNSEEFIGDCLENLESQTINENLEIIVVDAASPQNEEKIVKEFQKRYTNITYIKTKSRIGIYSAWNIAIKEASGRYCISASTNDNLNQEACGILARYLDENPKCMLVYGDTYLTKTPHERFEKNTHSDTYKWPPYSFKDHLHNCLVGPHPMWRKQIHSNIGFFCESYFADGDQEFWLRIGYKYNIAHIPFFTGLQLISDDSISRKGLLPHLEVMQIRSLYKKRFSERIEKKIYLCSIIIPVFNQVEYTKQCIEALYKNTPQSLFEIIVVDNNSTDGTKDYLCGIPEKVNIITNKENLGFAKACNQGVEYSKGYYLVFLNNDTLPQPGWLDEMIKTAEKDSLVGMVGSKLLYPDGTIQHAGVYFNKHGIPYHAFRSAPGDHPAVLVTRETPGVTGACMLMPKQLFQHIGGFNEEYHMYVEDADLCLRTWDAGFKVVYCAESVLTHFESASIMNVNRRDAQVREAWNHLHKSWRNKWPTILQELSPENISHKIDLNYDPKRNNSALKESTVLWHAPIFDPSGYADEARNFILQLQKQNIQPAVREIGRRSDVFRDGLDEKSRTRLDKAIAQETPEDFISIVQFPAYAFERVPQARYHIGRTTFETDGLPADWVQKCNLMDEIWVPSEFNMQSFKSAGVTSRLFKVPEGVDSERFRPGLEALHIPASRGVVFLSIFEWIYRKGWDILLKSWAKAFDPDDDVSLVLRTYPMNDTDHNNAKQEIEQRVNHFLGSQLKLNRDNVAPIIVLADQLHEQDMPRLYAAADAYVLPSRGEGWGRTQMEAMACGLPVISTRWGGNLDFMNDHNSLLIDIDGLAIIDMRAEIPFYRGQKWADPSAEHLSTLMRKVIESPSEVQKIGRSARLDVKRYWRWERIAGVVAKRLQVIESERNGPMAKKDISDNTYRIRWEGSQFVNHSLALVNREICIELAKRDDIELSLIPYEPDEFGVEKDPERFDLIRKRMNAPLSAAADFHVRHQWPPNFTPPPEGHWIIIQPWEFGALPKDWVDPMETLVDELWVPSNYVRDVYVSSGISASKVFVVPNGVNYHQFNPAVSEYELDIQKRFKFLFVGGTIERKGIDILLSAYTETFTSKDDVCLVIKDMGGESFYRGQNASQMIGDIKKDPASPEILYLTGTLKHEEIAGLYTACNCLVHPYRGEGFGLPVAEAMACGLPVIVTKGGACDDFCTAEYAYLIDSTVRPVHLNNYVPSAPAWLLEPDKSQLIEMLKFVYQHPNKAREKGAIAARQIRKKIDWKMSADQIRDRLKSLKGKPIRRFASSANSPSVQVMKSPQEIYQTIQDSIENKSPEEVINELEMLAESFPQFALAHNDLGVMHYQAGSKEKAHQFYKKAVQLDPANMIFQKNLADFYYVEMGRVKDALRIYVKILEANPEDVEILLITGHICVALEKFQDANVFYSRVLEIEPGHQDALQFLDKLNSMKTGNSGAKTPQELYRDVQPLLNNGDPHRAIGALEHLLEEFPDFALAHNDLGVLYYHTGDKEKAQHHYERAVEMMPENINFKKNLADLYCLELGRIEEALKIYVDILTTYPQDIETLLATGNICVALEEPGDARDFYHRVLELEPGNEDAGNNLRALDKRPTANGLSPAESENTFSVLADKVESNDFEAYRSEAENRTATVSLIISLDGIQNRVKECIKSVMEHTPNPHEILLINRGATKGILKWAQQLVKENDPYQIIECARQAGWAESLNRAVQKASGEMIVLMHNDVTVPAGWHKAFKMCIDLVPNIGVVGPMSNRTEGIQQMIHFDESDRVDFESAAKAFYEQNQYRRVTTRKLSEFFLVFPRELPDKIGYFDEQFVSEDVVVEDFCKRAVSGGNQNLIAADTYVHHYDRHKVKKSASTRNQENATDRKKYKEKWNGTQNPQTKAFLTVQLLARAEELSQKGQIDPAVEVLLGGIGVQPEDPRFYLGLSEILLAAKKFQDAKEALTEMPPADENQEMRKAQLLAYAEEGLENYEAAEAQIEKVLLMNPDHAPALNLKGILTYRNDDPISAEKYFNRAIDSDPGYGEPCSNLGMLSLATDRPQDTLKFFEKGFRLTPTDLDIATNYHSYIGATADFIRAEVLAREAAALYPNNQKIRYMLIDFLVQQGKYEMAMPEIEDAIIKFGTENGIIGAALKVREKLGPITIQKFSKKTPVSVCMIIKDEEKYLARCLASVKPIVDEMIVVDTGSTDRSKDIAVTFGAKVYDYEWKNDFGEARNYSISKASGEWILILDGDEVISPLDHAHFSKMVKKTPRAPIAYSIITRNYNKLANIVGWMPNDGTYPEEEAAIGWLPSEKVRLFYGKDQIWFEGPVHELVDPVLKRNGIEIKKCHIPVHHYGRLDKEKLDRKGEIYFDIGRKKLSALGDDLNALRELAVQATILEKNQEAFELWQRLLALNPIPNLAAIAYVNMGTIYSRLGKFEDALDAGKKAVKHDPDLKEARYNYAMAELHCGNSSKTIRVLEDLLKGFPDYPPARFILSAAYCCADQKEKGLEGIRKLRDTPMGAHLDIPCLELAQSLIAAGKMEYALWVLGAAIESDIVNPQLLTLFKECLNMKEATQKHSHIPQPPQANFQEAILENLPQQLLTVGH